MAVLVTAKDGFPLTIYATLEMEKVKAIHEPMGDTVKETEYETLADYLASRKGD